MNSLGLIYRELPLLDAGGKIIVPSSNEMYKVVRKHIKPRFQDWKLKANNRNGVGTNAFNRRLGRFKSDWLDFEILNLDAPPNFYPTEGKIGEFRILQDTAVADVSQWRDSIKKQVAEEKTYLLVGMTALIDQSKFCISMLSSGLPPQCWPCEFEVFDFVVTNAPLCQFVRYRPHVIV